MILRVLIAEFSHKSLMECLEPGDDGWNLILLWQDRASYMPCSRNNYDACGIEKAPSIERVWCCIHCLGCLNCLPALNKQREEENLERLNIKKEPVD
ncbi:hypothetical protein ZIOFF_026960 [Zingiber officinale]|uniref:Uncharacterized protein n=1 Tax=Zingiber officinale TaxID=94328 RepID=A0A8J5L7N2_ZINOF|nr:hypothetical protein ZIOFF_026960 [Zingiber officinale]